jgi:CHAT domain-containing protein
MKATTIGFLAATLLAAAIPGAKAQTATFVAPPRTIADVAAILDQEKPDPERIGKLRAEADATPPVSSDNSELSQFYYRRAQARSALGRLPEAVADTETAIEHRSKQRAARLFFMQQFLVVQYSNSNLGNPSRALELLAGMERQYENSATRFRLFTIYRHRVNHLVSAGDLERAAVFVEKSIALLREAQNDPRYDQFGSSWEADVELSRAFYLEARGQYREAEAAYLKSESLRRDSLERSAQWPDRPPEASFRLVIDGTLAAAGRVKALQGRAIEAEVDSRRALLSQLKTVGKYRATTAAFVRRLAQVLLAQGRTAEAERLARIAVDIFRTIGFAEDSQVFAVALNTLASTLHLQARWGEAAQTYGELEKATAGWERERREFHILTPARIDTLYRSGAIAAGLDAARRLVGREVLRVGDQHFGFGVAKGVLAVGLARSGRDAEALPEFRAAIPLLTSPPREDEDEEGSAASERDRQVRDIVETYIALLARNSGSAAANESFALAEAIRARSVQSALAASTARLLARDAHLAELVRREQDLRKQAGAQLGLLNNLLALPPEQREERTIAELRARIQTFRAEHEKVRAEIGRLFPDYADLIDPRPPAVEDLRPLLQGDEALLSFYFGREHSFVWVLSKAEPVRFARIDLTAAELERSVAKLRAALEPNAASVEDIPPFDLSLAYQLYRQLLEPVAAGWRPATNLIVVTNGALGALPLAVLPVAPVEHKPDVIPAFVSYRAVPWLARSHSVTVVPSVAAFRTLRRLPPGSAQRERLVGFGDPYFSAAHADETAQSQQPSSLSARGTPLKRRAAPRTQEVNSAALALLPRLPDTADELKSVAIALERDPAKVLHLGKAANEAAVKGSELSRYRIIVFATHGLVPGDLDGLTQPALALSAPEVAGVPGDGLLTMDEILSLKLDADWVVLSACNTGSAAEAGAEAASGLGRAFFYAGTRALLLTNWSVHSTSARELVTELFRRQAADPILTRAQALREAAMGLLDSGVFRDDAGQILFTYAHPLFWAPYTIIGDGGRLR